MVRAVSFSLPLSDNSIIVDGMGTEELAIGSLVTGGTGWYPLVWGTLMSSKTLGWKRALSLHLRDQIQALQVSE